MKKQRRQDCETGLVALRAVDVDIGLFLCSIRRRYTTAGIELHHRCAGGRSVGRKGQKQIENLIQGV